MSEAYIRKDDEVEPHTVTITLGAVEVVGTAELIIRTNAEDGQLGLIKGGGGLPITLQRGQSLTLVIED